MGLGSSDSADGPFDGHDLWIDLSSVGGRIQDFMTETSAVSVIWSDLKLVDGRLYLDLCKYLGILKIHGPVQTDSFSVNTTLGPIKMSHP